MSDDIASEQKKPSPHPVGKKPILPNRISPVKQPQGERGGTDGPEPTRYGDWEHNGRCSDF